MTEPGLHPELEANLERRSAAHAAIQREALRHIALTPLPGEEESKGQISEIDRVVLSPGTERDGRAVEHMIITRIGPDAPMVVEFRANDITGSAIKYIEGLEPAEYVWQGKAHGLENSEETVLSAAALEIFGGMLRRALPEGTPPRPEMELDQSKLISVDGYPAQEFELFDPRVLLEPSDREPWNEVYFETASGNRYALVRKDALLSDKVAVPGDTLVLLNERKAHEGFVPDTLHPEDFTSVMIGEKFMYGDGGQTTRVTRITAVQTHRLTQDLTGAPESSIRSEFWKAYSLRSVPASERIAGKPSLERL